MLNTERVRMLVQATKNGSHKKGEGTLRQDIEGVPHFCIFGLACELSGVGEWVETPGGYWNYQLPSRYYYNATLPPEVARFYGFPDVFVWLKVDGARVPLSSLNDEPGMTFPKLGDLLERGLLGATN